MKKKVLFKVLAVLTLGLMIGFSSCKDDDDDSIVGKWKFNSITADMENSYSQEAVETAKKMMQEAVDGMKKAGATLEVKSDNTFTLSAGGFTLAAGTYTEKDGIYSVTVDGGGAGAVVSNDYINSGSTITVKDGTLTIVTDALDDDYKGMGFTKYVITTTLKK